jgi:hypothetical protein
MTINCEQIHTLKADADKSADNFKPTMVVDTKLILSLLAERDADKALIAELAGALEDCVYRIDCTITKGEATLLDIETARKAHALLTGITLDVGK